MKIWNPGVFQGRGKKKDYFEGWYFKSVSKDENTAFAIIPGVSITKNPEKSHAFIMVMDARKQTLYYFEYPLSDFWANKKEFEIKIGENSFSTTGMKLNLEDKKHKITAELNFENIIPWPVKLFSPGVMGWYAFIPLMECYHAVLSFNHTITGNVKVNETVHDFSGGKGYMEKDWGSSMPSSWIWMQTNHFEEKNASSENHTKPNNLNISFFGSIAKIPWLRSFFTGYIFGFYLNGQLYRFTTYTGAKIDKLMVSDEKIEIIACDNDYILEISADRTEGVDLPAPTLGEMKSRVNESLRSRINVKLMERNKNKGQNHDTTKEKVIFQGTGRNAGLEFVGDLEELLSGFRK